MTPSNWVRAHWQRFSDNELLQCGFFCCCFPCWLGRHKYKKARRHKRWEKKEKKRQDRISYLHGRRIPMGQVFNSQRSLITLPDSDSQIRKPVSSQQNCLLLTRLPIDVRQYIWDYYAGGMTLYLGIANERGAPSERGHLFQEPWHRNYDIRHPTSNNPKPVTFSAEGDFQNDYATQKRKEREWWPYWDFMDIVPLLLTCRQIYSEVIRTFLWSNTFKTDSAITIQFLPDCLLPQRIDSIRTLQFIWNIRDDQPPLPPAEGRDQSDYQRRLYTQWITVWKVLAGMKGLVDLRISLDLDDRPWEDMDFKSASSILEPINSVTTPSYFEIRLAFRRTPSAEARRAWESLPCHIMWIMELTDSELMELAGSEDWSNPRIRGRPRYGVVCRLTLFGPASLSPRSLSP